MAMWNVIQRNAFFRHPTLSHVPRVEIPSWDVFSGYFVDHAAPVVITGSALYSGHPVTLDKMVHHGTSKIHVNVRSGDYFNVKARRQESMSLSEYFEHHIQPAERAGDEREDMSALPLYAGNTPLTHEQFEALGFRSPRCFDGQTFDAPRLWFGPKGSATPLHYDSRDNLICQYIGRKHLTLYPPSQIPWLYTHGYAPSWSSVPDPRCPDLRKFPLFARAKAVEVTLRAGEILYLPKRWSHFVMNLDTSVMVNFWPEFTGAQRARIELRRWARRWRSRLLG
jgi:hypothetical protein